MLYQMNGKELSFYQSVESEKVRKNGVKINSYLFLEFLSMCGMGEEKQHNALDSDLDCSVEG